MKRIKYHLGLAFIIGLFSCKKNTEVVPVTSSNDQNSGGTMTVMDATSQAFSNPGPILTSADLQRHKTGDVNFDGSFVAPPAPVFAGLGPILNNNSCTNCHINDGRGQPPAPGQPLNTMLFRISIPGTDVTGGPLSAPGFGTQLQTRAVAGVVAEADNVQITYSAVIETMSDGEVVTLRSPQYMPLNPYIGLPSGYLLSPRVAPAVFGLGLLEAIDESTILAFADPDDANGDGISGKPNYVWDAQNLVSALGRFGWKASQPNVRQQNAGAFNQDMGVTSSLFPNESAQGQLQDVPTHAPEITDDFLQQVSDYIRTLGVPARRNLTNQQAIQGKALFIQIGCSKCHIPVMSTGNSTYFSELSQQTIRPYTDLLLHDMGPGLADNRPDFLASGSEWRTAPLWGLGLIQVVNNHTFLLHDGRARNAQEAILWHGGEALSAKNAYKQLSKTDRDALVFFLNSL